MCFFVEMLLVLARIYLRKHTCIVKTGSVPQGSVLGTFFISICYLLELYHGITV